MGLFPHKFMKKEMYIRGLPFESLLRSALETFPKETTGEVFGYFDSSSLFWEVSYVQPTQLAKRNKRSSYVSEGVENLDWTVLQEHLGGFHSHPYDSDKTRWHKFGRSRADGRLYDLRSNKIEMIIALYGPTYKTFVSDSQHIISGFIPLEEEKDFLRFDIGVYYWGNRNIEKLKIRTDKEFLDKIRELR